MIFDSNITDNSSTYIDSIPMAEGYDSSYGAAKALVESARNDYKMFKALLSVDAREMNIMNESSGYVLEGELYALAEAAGKGIIDKIKQLFSKLIAKIKAIFNTFMSKLDALFKNDRQMVNKYEKELLRKSYLGKMKVKWRKLNHSIDYSLSVDLKLGEDKFSDDPDEREKSIIHELTPKINSQSLSDYEEDMEKYFLEDEDTMQLSETDAKDIRSIMDYLKNSKKLDDLKRNRDKLLKCADNCLKNLNDAIRHNENLSAGSDGKYKGLRGYSYESSMYDYDHFNYLIEANLSFKNRKENAKKIINYLKKNNMMDYNDAESSIQYIEGCKSNEELNQAVNSAASNSGMESSIIFNLIDNYNNLTNEKIGNTFNPQSNAQHNNPSTSTPAPSSPAPSSPTPTQPSSPTPTQPSSPAPKRKNTGYSISGKDGNYSGSSYGVASDKDGLDSAGRDALIKFQKSLYDLALSANNVLTTYSNSILNIAQIYYKQNKAAFMKAIAASDEKLKNESTYLDAVYEAAEYATDDYFCSVM